MAMAKGLNIDVAARLRLLSKSAGKNTRKYRSALSQHLHLFFRKKLTMRIVVEFRILSGYMFERKFDWLWEILAPDM